MEVYCQINNNRLIPEHDTDYEKLKGLHRDVTYKVTLTRPRNYLFLKKFFALLNLAYQNQDTFNNLDDMRDWLTMSAGFYSRVQTPTGEIFKPKSISFAGMSEDEFEDVYNRVADEICKWLDLSDEDLQENLIHFL